MLTYQSVLQIRENDLQLIKEIRDSSPLWTMEYKKAVTLLELGKGTSYDIIARELNLTISCIVYFKNKYLNKGMECFISDSKLNINDELKSIIKTFDDAGLPLSEKDLAVILNRSVATIRRLLRKNNIFLYKSRDSKISNSDTIDGKNNNFELCSLHLSESSGHALLYTNNNDIDLYSDNEKSNANSSMLLMNLISKIIEFISLGALYLTNYISIKEIVDCENFKKGKFVAITFGNEKEIEEIGGLRIIKKNDSKEFISCLKLYLKSNNEQQNYLGKTAIEQISNVLGKVTSNNEFIWRMSLPNRAYNLNIYDKNKENVSDNKITKIKFTIEITEDDKTIKKEFTKDVGTSLLNDLPNSKDLNDFLHNFGAIEDGCRKAAIESTRSFFDHSIDEIMINSKKKIRCVTVEGMLGRKKVLIPSDIALNIGSRKTLYTPELTVNIIKMLEKSPYRDVADNLNNLLLRSTDPINYRRLEDLVVELGKVRESIKEKLFSVLKAEGYDEKTGIKIINNKDNTLNHNIETEGNANSTNSTTDNCDSENNSNTTNNTALYNQEILQRAINYIIYHNANDPNTQIPLETIYEIEYNPKSTLYASIDDVFTPHQSEHRGVNKVKGNKYVVHTNLTIKYSNKRYYFTCDSTREALCLLLAFILKNKLEDYQLVITFDGAKEIRKYINEIFVETKYPPIFRLDWYHLCKRINELSSMAFNGKKFNDQIKSLKGKIFKQLWYGNVKRAINIIDNIHREFIKDFKRLNELRDYLVNRQQYICCYALRRKLHLINSSNMVERANFLIVCKRQKHNGYSWGYIGSHSLATLTALTLNGELDYYILTGDIDIVAKEDKDELINFYEKNNMALAA